MSRHDILGFALESATMDEDQQTLCPASDQHQRLSVRNCALFHDQFIAEDKYYNAYCLYFSKFIDAYKDEGINITSLAYQNEAYSNTPYPGCSWKAVTTGKFLANYLGPYFAEHHPEVSLIIGTMNTASNLPAGIYIVKSQGKQMKIAVKQSFINYHHT